jgi:hypothetical protein
VGSDAEPARREPFEQAFVDQLTGEPVGGGEGEVRAIGELRQRELRAVRTGERVQDADGATENGAVALSRLGLQGRLRSPLISASVGALPAFGANR